MVDVNFIDIDTNEKLDVATLAGVPSVGDIVQVYISREVGYDIFEVKVVLYKQRVEVMLFVKKCENLSIELEKVKSWI